MRYYLMVLYVDIRIHLRSNPMNKTYSKKAEDLGAYDREPEVPSYFYKQDATNPNLHSIYLTGNILDQIHKYVGLSQILRSLTQDDQVRLYISSDGGSLDTGIFLCNSIRASRAFVGIVVPSTCSSMAACLALSGDALFFEANTSLMFHNYSCSTAGKGGEILDTILDTKKCYNALLLTICRPFLTRKEVESIQNDKDLRVYWNDEDLPLRLGRHYKHLAKAKYQEIPP